MLCLGVNVSLSVQLCLIMNLYLIMSGAVWNVQRGACGLIMRLF
jgi:hypothetical protein